MVVHIWPAQYGDIEAIIVTVYGLIWFPYLVVSVVFILLSMSDSSNVTPNPRRQRNSNASRAQPRLLTGDAVGALVTGLVLAIPLTGIGLLRTLFYGFVIMVHELGHAAAYWLFGYPAVPSVNLLFGGGITLAMGRIWLLVWLILAGLGYLIYRYRSSSNALSWLLGATAVYGLFTFSSWHTLLISYAGHGAENLAIVLCLYFAMGGYFCKLGGERTIYAMLGFFTWFVDLQFAWQLMYDAAKRTSYINGIGGMLDNDFVTLADGLGMSLDAIATLFLLTSLISPVVAFLLYRYERYWQRALRGF